MMLAVVILSTGRAGSGYISRLLSEAGVPCSHEGVFTPRKVKKPSGPVESSWLALPHVEKGRFDGRVFHQVRDPLKVLSSLLNGSMQANRNKPYAHFQKANLHGDYPSDPTAFAVRFVTEWNERCERQAELTWRVEDVDSDVVRTAAAAAGAAVTVEDVEGALARVPATTNKHRDGPQVTWDSLAHVEGADRLREQAGRYGYLC